ncbi:MAG: polysaccharide deacetylase family protein [Candidatus Delongbacteria bacterium]|nr:polysaccharide deacetylase family protein [Candidatus Delongbacteria bacterium]MDD4205049.1 polysaccharide deacetylase family protein [Candidatus Delongbacteria bacterium]
MDLFYKPPKIIKKLFPGIIWDNDENEILITIDDGPSKNTGIILESLERLGLKAVFFCTGKNIEKYPDEFNSIIKAGHSVQNHGYHHKRMIFKNQRNSSLEILRTNKVINDRAGKYPVLFRPPYGWFNINTVKSASDNGMKIMLWTILSGDHTGDFSTVRRLTDSYLTSNSIIVMHDNIKASIIFDQSLEYIFKTAEDRKFDFSLRSNSK